MRRRVQRQHVVRRLVEQSARCRVVAACQHVAAHGIPVVQVTRHLGLSERTVRRWRQAKNPSTVALLGRPPQCASRDDRNLVYQFLKERGPTTPLMAVRAAFPQLRRLDVADMVRRFRRLSRRRAQRHQSRLQWRRVGAVWAADFKERREPLEGRYGWLLSIKDLASGYQLAWQPLVEATATAVQAVYADLFNQHGPPLIMKSDNGGQFKADETKDLLAAYQVIPLYSPRRHPQYNGAVERANGQVAGYQEAIACQQDRPAGPTCDDARSARDLANDLAHPQGWRGPTARQLWEGRTPITYQERRAFQNTVGQQRAIVRATWELAPEEARAHYPAAAVDRRAVRDALVAHDLLRIHPRRRRMAAPTNVNRPRSRMQDTPRAGTISGDEVIAAPAVGAADRCQPMVTRQTEEAHSSADNPQAGGQN